MPYVLAPALYRSPAHSLQIAWAGLSWNVFEGHSPQNSDVDPGCLKLPSVQAEHSLALT